ncbi:MAG: DNA gyrase subunit A, partial [archaeon]|nr:DNA gyrase subunit A [archaeon]
KGTQTQTFFTLPEYLNWKVAHNGAKGWTIKYYKGLGTSSPTEAREYFGNLPRHLIQFHYTGQNDDKQIEMAFSKKDKAADERKNWLRTYNPGTFLDQNVSQVSYSDFIDKELILFSHADCIRSIPHLLDGFKPGQRKVLYGCFKKNLKNEVKVAQLSGYIGEHAAYHHGEISLQDTIVKMAQTFVGSNNLALLFPAGMFGSRLMGGKDHASARYINTRLSKVARAVFHEADDHLLTYLDDDGFTIEPEYYVPIIPMVLVNGAEGIGTGWSTSVPTYSPYDLIDALRALIQGQEPKPLHPYFRGFYGRVETQPNEPGCYLVRGCWDILEDEELTIRIWELPVKMWTSNFKKFLELCIEKNQISNYREYHTETKVHFTIQLAPEQFKAIDAAGIEKFFKLHCRVLTTNMHLYSGEDNQITHFTSARQILDAYYDIRLVFYSRRKEYLVAQLTEEVQRLENKCRFIQMVIDGHLEIRNKPKSEIVLQLQKHKFKLISQSIANRKTIREGNTDQILTTYEAEADASGSEDEGGSSQQADISKLITGYDYLLSMKLWALSKESIQKLRNQAAERTQELRVLLQTSPQQMWLNDLKNLEEILDTIEAAEYQSSIAVVAAASSGSVIKKRDRNTQNKKLKSVLPPHPADDLPFAKRSVVSVGRIGDSGITVEKRATERRPRSTQNQASASFDDSLNNSSMLANEDIPKSLALDNSQHVSSSSSSSSSIAPVVAKKEPVKKEPVKKEPIKKPVASVVKLPTAAAKPAAPKPAAPKSRKKVISDSDEESSSFEPSQDSDDWQPSRPKKSLFMKPSRNIIDSDDVEPALSKAPVARSKAPEPVKVEKAISSKSQAAPPARSARAAAVKASQNLVIEDDSLSDPSPLSDFDL